MRLSRTSAVFPAPDGPASAVSRCSGKAAVTSCRLYRSPISRAICPPGPGRAGRSRGTAAAPARNGPMIECGSVSSWPGVPWAITVPPWRRPPGPSSMTQSAARMSSRSCSTTTTELPFPARAVIVLQQPGDVARVQPDRRLVQHVQHARGAGPHRRGELDPLPLPGRQRGAGPVQGQVAQPDVEQRREPAVQFGEQAGRHPAELGGQPGGQAGREPAQLVQAERADLGDVAPAELRGQRLGPQPGAVAHRADAGDEEPLHQPAGALVVAAQRAFDRGDRVVVVDRQLHGPPVPARAASPAA